MKTLRPPLSLATWLAEVRATLPRALVPDAAFAALEAMTRGLPRVLTDWVYFESRLAEPGAPVDLILRVGPHGLGALRQADRLDGWIADSATPGWQLALRVAREGSAAWIDNLWLEFDAGADEGAAARSVAAPGVFLDVSQRPGGPDVTGVAELAELLLPAGSDVVHALRRCVARLPQGVRVPYLGCFPHRDPGLLRICCRGITARGLPRFLKDVGWPGDPGDVLRLADSLGDDARSSWQRGGVVHLDLGDGVRPRLGLEYPLARGPQWSGRLAEQDFVQRLVQAGLCTEPERDALECWPGHGLERRGQSGSFSALVRRINHVKLQVEPGQRPHAKAYGCLYRARLESRRGSISVDRSIAFGASRGPTCAPFLGFSRGCDGEQSGHVACLSHSGVPQSSLIGQEPT